MFITANKASVCRICRNSKRFSAGKFCYMSVSKHYPYQFGEVAALFEQEGIVRRKKAFSPRFFPPYSKIINSSFPKRLHHFRNALMCFFCIAGIPWWRTFLKTFPPFLIPRICFGQIRRRQNKAHPSVSETCSIFMNRNAMTGLEMGICNSTEISSAESALLH